MADCVGRGAVFEDVLLGLGLAAERDPRPFLQKATQHDVDNSQLADMMLFRKQRDVAMSALEAEIKTIDQTLCAN
jgi:hypothetical protein